MTSPKQIDANRRNAQKSTGPKSRPGKDKTRFNGLKHGLRAEHVILPGEDPAAFDAERQGWADDWGTASHTRAVLVERAAAISWKLRRSVRVETARLTTLADAAALQHDARNRALVITGMARFRDDPDTALSVLRSHPAGLDHLLKMVDDLLGDLDDLGRWDVPHQGDVIFGLLGYPAATNPADIADDVDAAIARDARDLLAYHDPATPASARPTEAAARRMLTRLRAYVLAARGHLAAERSRFADAATSRAAAIDAALVDDSSEGRLQHRYEMAHDRALRATVKELRTLAKSEADLAGRDVETETSVVKEVATESPTAASVAPTEANPRRRATLDAPSEANFEAAEPPIPGI